MHLGGSRKSTSSQMVCIKQMIKNSFNVRGFCVELLSVVVWITVGSIHGPQWKSLVWFCGDKSDCMLHWLWILKMVVIS